MALAPIVYDPALNQHRPALSTEAIVSANTPETYTSGATPPATPVVGDRWRNTDAGTVSGVPTGLTATWNGSTWDFVAIPAAAALPTILPGSVT